jgi:short-subunit dehydrogenase
MTRLVLPGMKERKRGAIVNIGSAAATVAPSGPLYAVYAGTKACTIALLLMSALCLKGSLPAV